MKLRPHQNGDLTLVSCQPMALDTVEVNCTHFQDSSSVRSGTESCFRRSVDRGPLLYLVEAGVAV